MSKQVLLREALDDLFVKQIKGVAEMKKMIALLMLPAMSLADPSAVTRYLINEPASLLDVGILRTELRIANETEYLKGVYEKSSGVKVASLKSAVIYDYQDDILSVEFSPLVRDPRNAEKGCKELQTELRGWLVDTIPRQFRHEGYKSRDQPERLLEEITERTVVFCIAKTLGRRSNIVTVRSPLSSDEMSVIRHLDDQ